MPGNDTDSTWWPLEHDRDVWDAPPIALTPKFTMNTGEAAKELGMSRYYFVRYLDQLGLTVYRRPNTKRLRFSRDEVAELKTRMEQTSVEQIVEASRKGRDYAHFFGTKKRPIPSV